MIHCLLLLYLYGLYSGLVSEVCVLILFFGQRFLVKFPYPIPKFLFLSSAAK